MKRIFAIIVTLFALWSANAQAPRDSVFRTFKRPFMLSVSLGKTINTGGNDNEYWFGKQRAVHKELTFRMTYYVFSHWGIYADVYFGRGGDWTPPIDVAWRYDGDCDGIGISAGIGIGCMYRFEHKRWQFFSRAGIGVGDIASASDLVYYGPPELDEIEDWYNSSEPHEYMYARRDTSPSYINLGVTGGYRLSKALSVILDLNYRYPISSSKVEISYDPRWTNGSEPQLYDVRTYTSRSWGNNLTISIGLQLQCELSPNRK